MSQIKVIKTVCRSCNVECGVKVHVKDNDVLLVEGDPDNPVSGGTLCPRGETEAIKELVNDEKRLKTPLMRKNGELVRASWDEALKGIAEKLNRVKSEFGASSISIYTGQAPGYRYFYWERLCNLIGTPNYATVAMLCFWAKLIGHQITYGRRSYPLLARGITGYVPEYEKNTKCVLVWGVNPSASCPYGGANILKLKKEHGAKLIVIDPRRIPLAKEADIWAPIRPGTDVALALGLMNVIINENLYDKDFVEKYTYGFEKLAKHVQEYTPERVEKITWISAPMIRDIARTYATNCPGVLLDHVGVELHETGFQAHRANACLIGLTGNIDVPGGNIHPPQFHVQDLSLHDQVIHGALDGEGIGAKEHPLMVKGKPHLIGSHMCQGMLLPKAIEEGKIKALVLVGADLLRVAPEVQVWKEAFKKLDTLIIIDLYKKKEYEDLAHFFLPAASWVEKTELVAGWDDPALSMRRKCVERWEAWPDYKICFELAKSLGHGDAFPWMSIEEAINDELKPTGFEIKDFDERSVIRHPSPIQYRKFERDGFKTPTKKLEFYSLTLEAYGYDPLPSYKEVGESPVSKPELAEKFPLIMTTGQKTTYRTHTQFFSIPSLRKTFPDPTVFINPGDASPRGIEEGAWVKLTSPRGEAYFKAVVTEDIVKGVVSPAYGFSGVHNANLLTRMGDVDPISGYPSLRDGLCQVEKSPRDFRTPDLEP
ncbi:MAG TPA: molybdopterin-dependent oxidoreductase [Synergistales bacterium]|nr:molybdopterin-dependent oxidoreductase [Synergistales bacterium]